MPRIVQLTECKTCSHEQMLVKFFERNCDYCGNVLHDRKYISDCGEFFCDDICHQTFVRNGDSKQCVLTKEQLDEQLEDILAEMALEAGDI